MVWSAVVRELEVIGEAVKNLSYRIREEYPEIPWRKMAGMRDVLSHGYFKINLDMVWETATVIIPEILPKNRRHSLPSETLPLRPCRLTENTPQIHRGQGNIPPTVKTQIWANKDDEKELEEIAKGGLEQIKERKYYARMKEKGYKVIGFGIAFCGKRTRIEASLIGNPQ